MLKNLEFVPLCCYF